MQNLQVTSEAAGAAVIPPIAIAAFCETQDVRKLLEQVQSDRRIGRARIDIFDAGIQAAIEHIATSGSPNLVVVEWRGEDSALFDHLERLAQECSQSTRVLVIGHRNDVGLYRELLARGVSDYAVAPLDVIAFCEVVVRIYSDVAALPVGRTVAFIGASGGVGSSTIAHNVAWEMATALDRDALLIDTDVAFGTAGINFNLEAAHGGIVDALRHAGRMDGEMLDRLLAKPHPRLGILAAPATIDSGYELGESEFERLMELDRVRAGQTLFDVPHIWNWWVRSLLKSVDQIVITAKPELTSLRNCKTLVTHLKAARPNDSAAKLVLNQVGVPRRTEIKPAEFAEAVGVELLAAIPYDPALFGTAANNGQMIGQLSKTSKATRAFRQIAADLLVRKGSGTKSNRQRMGSAGWLWGKR